VFKEDEAGRASSEIAYWLDFSTLFYNAFIDVERNHGAAWFAINILAGQPGASSSVRLMMVALQDANALGTNPTSGTTNVLEQLRDAGYINLFEIDGKTSVSRASFESGYFPSETPVIFTAKALAALEAYVPNAVQMAFGWPGRKLSRGRELLLTKEIYAFMWESYIPLWINVLRKLSLLAVINPDSKQDNNTIFNEMVGTTEYFVVLLMFWDAQLKEEDTDGFDVRVIARRCRTTRELTDAIIKRCVTFLAGVQILEGKERFRLNTRCESAFEEYAEGFVGLQEKLRAQLVEQFPVFKALRPGVIASTNLS
jgi:hypothetical protein